MATSTDVITATVWEDQSLTVMARLLGNDGENIAQADFDNINASVWDTTDTSTPTLDNASLTISSVVSDTLVTDDDRWDVDTIGYNFVYTVPASAFPNGGRVYRMEVKFDPTSGDDWFMVVDITSQKLLTS